MDGRATQLMGRKVVQAVRRSLSLSKLSLSPSLGVSLPVPLSIYLSIYL